MINTKTLKNYSFTKPKSRFNLLLLEPGEQYLNDCSCDYIDKTTQKQHKGTLKICSFSLFFTPDEKTFPIRRFEFQHIKMITKTKEDTIILSSQKYTDMKDSNIIKPFTTNEESKDHYIIFKFVNYEEIFQLINRMHKLNLAGDKEDIFEYGKEYINSRLDTLQPHMGMFMNIGEDIVYHCPCIQVLPLMEISGRFILTQYAFYFIPYVEDSNVVKQGNMAEMVFLFRRRYLMKHNGLEFFFAKTSAFFVFDSKEIRDKIQEIIYTSTKCKLKEDYGEQFNEIINKWKRKELSNYEYLIYLNFMAGRSYNDLTQYPVFPWVISNYSSPTLDLNDPSNYRDLSKPIGALNPERLERLKERMNEMTVPLFLYGTHYSTPAYVVYYLVRLVPEFMLHLQSGVFDKPDRIFSSIEECWNCVCSHSSDVKELVPEFYQNVNFLTNKDHVYFGFRTSEEMVDDVKLPNWASNPKEFSTIMNNALESEYVSQNINKWIDLIFGYLQKPPLAYDVDNVFHPTTYENDFTDSTTISFRDQVREFGQIPSQLFQKPSPERYSQSKATYPIPPIQATDMSESFDDLPLSEIDFRDNASRPLPQKNETTTQTTSSSSFGGLFGFGRSKSENIAQIPKQQQPSSGANTPQKSGLKNIFNFGGFFGKK